ncbi:hypothetical protein [[Mycoplasma] gypis]|uniref:Uncharacterized protein n=1 Tax=[Mycoplasma] gypis TaxID=92404 RepID=A0ABZ2RNI5_9BACT|nr:hypothetical protein [[Mycoplasma] gypis]MBN0919419.1 hypothetical protein [[Mycoplasma] gypis]
MIKNTLLSFNKNIDSAGLDHLLYSASINENNYEIYTNFVNNTANKTQLLSINLDDENINKLVFNLEVLINPENNQLVSFEKSLEFKNDLNEKISAIDLSSFGKYFNYNPDSLYFKNINQISKKDF